MADHCRQVAPSRVSPGSPAGRWMSASAPATGYPSALPTRWEQPEVHRVEGSDALEVNWSRAAGSARPTSSCGAVGRGEVVRHGGGIRPRGVRSGADRRSACGGWAAGRNRDLGQWLPADRSSVGIARTIGDRIGALQGYPIDSTFTRSISPGVSRPSRARCGRWRAAVACRDVRSIGVSSFSACQMCRAAAAALRVEGVEPAANQVQSNLLHRNIERNGVLGTARKLGVALIWTIGGRWCASWTGRELPASRHPDLLATANQMWAFVPGVVVLTSPPSSQRSTASCLNHRIHRIPARAVWTPLTRSTASIPTWLDGTGPRKAAEPQCPPPLSTPTSPPWNATDTSSWTTCSPKPSARTSGRP
ncbi:aldo/keto reductase [Streptomyces sp. NPDC088801]|uniref:aldo/keto reductase n=1 Tax=Streptomyces sp. NPDC088801 TaxID=3365903 RepID=UPI00380B24FA